MTGSVESWLEAGGVVAGAWAVAGTASGEVGVDGDGVSGNADCGAGAAGIVVRERCINEPFPFPRCECSTARINVVAKSAHAQ